MPANEFLNLEGRKMSTSQNFAVWLPDYLERYDPDPLRYFLTINAPETRDADFSWAGLLSAQQRRAGRHLRQRRQSRPDLRRAAFRGTVPEPQALGEADRALLDVVHGAFERVGELIEGCRFKDALREVMAVAQALNRYIDAAAPWATIKSDRAAAETALYVCLQAIASLAVLTAPFLPTRPAGCGRCWRCPASSRPTRCC